MTDESKVRENRLRRVAGQLMKSRRRDPRAHDFGAYADRVTQAKRDAERAAQVKVQ